MSSVNTGCKSQIQKIFEFKIWKEPMSWKARSQKPSVRPYAWHPPDNAMPLNFTNSKIWVVQLSFELLLVSVLALVPSEYWKRLEIFFCYFVTLRKLRILYYFEKISSAFFNIVKEPLLVQKQTIAQMKALIFSFSNL